MGTALASAAQPASDQWGSSNRTLGSGKGTTIMLSSPRLPYPWLQDLAANVTRLVQGHHYPQHFYGGLHCKRLFM